MYSTTAGAGLRSAPAGSHRRAASRQPSRSGIQACSICRTAWGKTSTTFTPACLLRKCGRRQAASNPECALAGERGFGDACEQGSDVSLFTELNRRNVIRVAGAYVAGAWLVVQVAETMLPVYGFGEGAIRTIVTLLAIGFVPALVLAWVFEI